MAGKHSVFIGYRREDTADVAGRVYDRLLEVFGKDAVFKDVDDLPVGADFGAYIRTVLPQCRVFLALIGPTWAEFKNEQGVRRLDDPEDWVRIELETALGEPGLRVVPVWVNDAPMPRKEQLPESMYALLLRNAASVHRDPYFHKDMDKLIDGLRDSIVAREADVTPTMIESSTPIVHEPVRRPAEILADLRATWLGFPAKGDVASVEKFLAHFRTQVTGSGLEFEIESHLDDLKRVEGERRDNEVAETEARTRPGHVWRDAILDEGDNCCPEMVTIARGSFLMGTAAEKERRPDSERPQHEVQIDYLLAFGKHPVSCSELKAASSVLGDLERSNRNWTTKPATHVSWEDAQAYIGWLNGKLGLLTRPDAYRLPSEAEWEYACRAGSTSNFSFGERVSGLDASLSVIALNEMQGGELRPIGSYPANAFGLHDMHGNVHEWCEDVWHDNYLGAPTDGSAWIAGDDRSRRVYRGGSYGSPAMSLRSAFRSCAASSDRSPWIGFRLARTLGSPRCEP